MLPTDILAFSAKLEKAFINTETLECLRAMCQEGRVPRPAFVKKRGSGYLGYYIGVITKRAGKFQALIIALYGRSNTYTCTLYSIQYNHLISGGDGPVGFDKNRTNWPFIMYYFFKRHFGQQYTNCLWLGILYKYL